MFSTNLCERNLMIGSEVTWSRGTAPNVCLSVILVSISSLDMIIAMSGVIGQERRHGRGGGGGRGKGRSPPYNLAKDIFFWLVSSEVGHVRDYEYGIPVYPRKIILRQHFRARRNVSESPPPPPPLSKTIQEIMTKHLITLERNERKEQTK